MKEYDTNLSGNTKGLLHSYLPLSRHKASLSQARLLGYLPSPHRAFQEHAAHPIEWSMELSSKGSSGTCIPEVLRHSSIFFFNDTATTEIYTLSLHDALPTPRHGLG